VDGSDVDRPEGVGNGLEGDELASEQSTDVDDGLLPADVPDLTDTVLFEVSRIGEGLGFGGERSRRRHVEGGRGFLVEALGWPDGVVEGAKVIEAALLSAEVLGRRPGGVFAQGSVHAFMAAILVGLTGLDEFGANPELDPGDGELGEPSEGRGGEGWAVIGSDASGQAEGSEEMLEAPGGPFQVESRQGVAIERNRE
jgi:hypothetical protein